MLLLVAKIDRGLRGVRQHVWEVVARLHFGYCQLLLFLLELSA